MRAWKILGLAGTLSLVMGCGDDAAAVQDDGNGGGDTGGTGGSGGDSGECPSEGATQCAGLLVQVCEATSSGLAWSEASNCAGDQRCRQNVCADPSTAQLAQIASSENYADTLVTTTGYFAPLDADAIKLDARTAILDGDGSDADFYAAMWGVLAAVPQGHQSLFSDVCGSAATPSLATSRFGVCARPHGDSLIVTFARGDNPLGLSAGDRIIQAGTDVGSSILEAAFLRPICGVSSPSESSRRGVAAATFFGTAPAGMELQIQPVEGETFSVTIPDTSDAIVTDCQDPLGRDISFNADAYLRPDGIGVVRLPRFYPIDATLPDNPTQQELEAFIQAFQADIEAAFDAVSSAPAIIWDARSNYGGITTVGLAIVGGMPTAQDMDLSYCEARIAASSPPAFYPQRYAEYAVETGGPFAYDGKVAVLIDELDYSAADYFPLAVTRATDTLVVGTPTAGAYGGPGVVQDLQSTPPLYFNVDVNRCSDASDSPLEGLSVMPDVMVEYDPQDLADGIDTVMETAAASLLID